MSDDGGMQWYAEAGASEEWEHQQRIEEAKRISAAIEAHRKWVNEHKEKAHGKSR